MGSLPFLTTGDLKDQGGSLLQADVPVSVWPVGGRTDSKTGQVYDHEGQADLDYEALMGGPNRSMTINSVEYKIVSGIPYLHVPHVQLLLRRVIPGGGF